MKKRIHVMVTAFRDGLQSAYGGRVFSADYLPVVWHAVAAGMNHLESGGGAMFQSAYFYAGEDAFSVMDRFRAEAGPDANLQTLARGINVVGLESQSSDIVRLHAKLLKKHGVTTVRNFDALNDIENLKFSGRCIVEAGLKHELAISMMELPPGVEAKAHTAESYVALLRELMETGLPFDSLCFKDASGTSHPQKVFETIRGARKLVGDNIKIAFHTHDTAGTGTSAYLSAIEAGVDQIDLSLAPCSGGTCQPDIITIWHALRGTEYDLGLDINRVIKVEELLKEALKAYPLLPEAGRVEPLIPFFPLPGGALTANTQMLRDNGLMDRYPEIISAMGEAIAKGGYATSVTPVSQYYFQQALNNVLKGPWKEIAEGYGKLVLGYMGKTPLEPDPEVMSLAEKQLGIPPAMESALVRNDRDSEKSIAAITKVLERNDLPVTDENIFIVATCRDKGLLYLKGLAKPTIKKNRPDVPEKIQASTVEPSIASGGQSVAARSQDTGQGAVTVNLNSRAYGVEFLSPTLVRVNGVEYTVSVENGLDEEAIEATNRGTVPTANYAASFGTGGGSPQARQTGQTGQVGQAGRSEVAELKLIESPLSGIVIKVNKKVGDKVAIGETILVVESMGIKVPINSSFSGIVVEIWPSRGDKLELGDPLARVRAIVSGEAGSISRARTGKVKAVGENTALVSPTAGIVLRIYKTPGEVIHVGESLLVLEALKMETPISSSVEGTLVEIAVHEGEQIMAGQTLATVKI
jgi:pyruvate carboxylase subunit B